MRFLLGWAIAGAMVLGIRSSRAAGHEGSSCARITRDNVAACALEASLVVEGARQDLEAARARKIAVSPLLPANPLLALSAGKRASHTEEATNWYATLSQELEVAGQRGLRREAAEASVDAQAARLALSRRDTALVALGAYFEVLAAEEEQRLAERLLTATRTLSTVARARAEQGLIAAVDADVAEAATLRVLQSKLAAERRTAAGRATLATLLGRDPSGKGLAVEGTLEPLTLDGALAGTSSPASPERPELRALDAERRAQEGRAAAFRRSRIPNPTVSLFVQNDGFNERVLGAGLAFPIPLPGNVGRTFVGEIAEAEALGQRARTEQARLAREIGRDVATARQAFESRSEEVRAFSPETLARAAESLDSLSEEVRTGRLPVKDAVLAEQSLIELLRAGVEARRALCLSSVDLARALGVSTFGGRR